MGLNEAATCGFTCVTSVCVVACATVSVVCFFVFSGAGALHWFHRPKRQLVQG